MRKNHSFSVKEYNTDDAKTVQDIKIWGLSNKVQFSHMCVEGLKLYKAKYIDEVNSNVT